jgi:hypothetical protein
MMLCLKNQQRNVTLFSVSVGGYRFRAARGLAPFARQASKSTRFVAMLFLAKFALPWVAESNG